MSHVDDYEEDIIRRKIYYIYEEQFVPRLDKNKLRLVQDETNMNCGRSTLHRILLRMGSMFRKINKRKVVMKSQRSRILRHIYLQEIKNYQLEIRPINYLHETWFDTHDTAPNAWVNSSASCQTKAPSNKIKRITILHAGSGNGWIPNCLLLSAKDMNVSSLDYYEDIVVQRTKKLVFSLFHT